jgi:hypothetical protein
MRPARAALGLCGLLAAVTIGAAGCYAPNPANGTLRCGGPNHVTCPEGYSCAGDGTCWKGSAGRDGGGGGASGAGGSGGGGASGMRDAGCGTSTDAGRVERFVGHWLFSAGATNVVTCSDQPNMPRTTSLLGDYLDVVPGVGSDLSTSYYCTWSLAVDNSGSSTTLLAGQSCQVTANDGTKFTWHGAAFKLMTADGFCGTLSASINADFVAPDNSTGTCMLVISGPLTKQ